MKRMLVCSLMVWLGACGPGVDAGPDDGKQPPEQTPPKDTTAPTLVSVSPADGATEVDSRQVLKFTFSEGMDDSATTPAVLIEEPAGLTLTKSWGSASRVLEVTSSVAFAPGQHVRWRIGTGARDTAGNALKAAVTGGFTVAGVADTTAPTVLSLAPALNAAGVPVRQLLRVTFSEPMNLASAEAAFFLEQPTGLTGNLGWDGDTLVFTPSTPWPWSQQVVWGVHAGAKDLRGNALAEDTRGTFTVMDQDVTRPTVTGPKAGATGMSRRFQLTLTFSEPMDRPSTEGALAVTASTGGTPQSLKGTVTWEQGDQVLNFVPDADAPYGAFIGWSLSTAAKDLADNALVSASAQDVFRVVRQETRVLSPEFQDGQVSLNYKSGSRGVDTDDRVLYVGGVGLSSADFGILMSRGFMSFDLSPIDPNATRITSAELAVNQTYVTDRSPYTKWGAMTWQAVDYGRAQRGCLARLEAGGRCLRRRCALDEPPDAGLAHPVPLRLRWSGG
jgi:hypothetical protein